MYRWLVVVFSVMAFPALAEPVPYTLNPGDVIKISAFDDERLDRELVVLPDGTISYPVVGEIHAAGMTVNDLQALISKSLVDKGFLQSGAVVDASVTKTTGYTVYVLGQVRQPGAFTTFANIDVMQALSMAGGLTPFASKSSIKVLRQENGAEVALPFDYGDVEDGDALDSNVVLHPGDTVVVPN
jgi:polysaccharide export outer membrane protein